MIFCGQCGLKIPTGATRCPRCGTAVDTVNTNAAFDDINTDGATIASLPYPMPAPPHGGFPQAGPPPSVGNPQRLILHADDNIAGASTPTSRVNAQSYGTYPAQPSSGASYSGYPPQSGVQHPIQGASSYPDHTPYPTYPAPPLYEPQQQRSRGRIVSLIVVLLGLLVLIGALALFTYIRFGPGHSTTPGGTSGTPGTGAVTTPSTTTVSPEQQAQAIVTQYYTDVNNKNYEGAYNLWQPGTNPSPTLTDFIKGYQYTLHDNLTVNKTAQLNDGTVQVSVTIIATEQTTTGGTTQSTYQGYYIVGQQNGTWKIQSGQLSKV